MRGLKKLKKIIVRIKRIHYRLCPACDRTQPVLGGEPIGDWSDRDYHNKRCIPYKCPICRLIK